MGVGLENPQGVGLEICEACWDTIPPRRPARHAGILPARHAGIPPLPVNRMTDRCKNITLPQISFAGGNKLGEK